MSQREKETGNERDTQKYIKGDTEEREKERR